MFLIVGLGNPGSKYERNRHNIGFMAIDAIADKEHFPAFKEKFQGLISSKDINGIKCHLLKPLTYMNNSGESVRAAAQFFKVPLENIVVIHDEIDLSAGKIRTKKGGGAAGHNGLRSIDAHMGKEYHRLRLGVGHPGTKDRVHSHVLGDFNKIEMTWVDTICESIADHLSLLLNKEIDHAVSKIATQVAPVVKDINDQQRKKQG